MRSSKRAYAALLLLSMLLSASACSESKAIENTDPTTPSDPSAVSGTETAEAVTEPDELADNLPETDLEGYNFRIACYLDTQIPTVYTTVT